MSVATLSLTAKTPETTTCQLADEYINRLCSIHTIEYLGKHTHTQSSKKSQIYLHHMHKDESQNNYAVGNRPHNKK